MNDDYLMMKSMIEEFEVGREVVKKITKKLIDKGITNEEDLMKLIIDVLWTREEFLNELEQTRRFSYDELVNLALVRYYKEHDRDIDIPNLDEKRRV